jgi:hypothetical protein
MIRYHFWVVFYQKLQKFSREMNQIADSESITGQSKLRYYPSFLKSENGINRREIQKQITFKQKVFHENEEKHLNFDCPVIDLLSTI